AGQVGEGLGGGGLAGPAAGAGVGPEGGEHGVDVGVDGGLVAGDADVVVVDEAQVHAPVEGGPDDLPGPAGHACQHGVEEGVVDHLDAGGAQARGQPGGVAVDARGDGPEAVGPVPLRVEGGHDGE